MKTFADMRIGNTNIYKNVSIFYVKKLKNSNPMELQNVKFYSKHKNEKDKKELIPVLNAKKPFFRYKNVDKLFKGEGSEESLTHETFKDIFASLKVLNLVFGNKKIKLIVDEFDIEYPIIVNERMYKADLLLKFSSSNPYHYFTKWKGKIVIEIKVSHAVNDIKRKDFENEGIAIFEYTVSEKFMLENSFELGEDEFNQKIEWITRKLNEEIYGKFISDPNSIEYNHWKKLWLEKQKLSEHNNLLSKKQSEIEKLNLNLASSIKNLKDSKRDDIYNLKESLKNSIGENENLKNELKLIKEQKLYKILNRFNILK